MDKVEKLVTREKLDLQINTNTEAKDSKGEEKKKNKSVEPETPRPSAQEKWSYNESVDCETSQADDGKTYTFRKEKSKNPRKVYFSMKIKRFSDIDNVRESFRCRYHLYLNWMITKKEYNDFLSAKKYQKEKKTSFKWEPKFKPRIEFVNNVEEHSLESVEYGHDGCYRVMPFTNWLEEEKCGFNCRKTLFIRQKLECDFTFSEQMELRSFPFDCQDFTIVVRESSGTKKAILLPEPRYTSTERRTKSNFFKLDPTFSVLDEWDFYSIFLEIADSSSGASRSKSVYHEITVRFKLKRKWEVYLYNIIFYFMIITFLGLTCFALDIEDIGERLNLAVVVLLTLVAFQHTVFEKLPNIPYLTFMHKYIIVSFIFVCVVIIESSTIPLETRLFERHVTGHDKISDDLVASWIFGAFWVLYHLGFILRAGWHRHRQSQKLVMDSDQIKEKVDEKYPQFLMSWKQLRELDEFMMSKSGSVDDWNQKAKTQRQNSFKAAQIELDKKKGGKRGQNKTKAVSVMEFGGERGEILTFASYAHMSIVGDETFCGMIGNKCNALFVKLIRCCCCGCFREDNRQNEAIIKKKSQAYDEIKALKASK